MSTETEFLSECITFERFDIFIVSTSLNHELFAPSREKSHTLVALHTCHTIRYNDFSETVHFYSQQN